MRFKNLLFGILALFLFAVLIEFALWNFLPVSDSLSYYRVINNVPGLKPHALYERNEFGLRSLSMRKKLKPSRTVRIICLGGSTTDQPNQSTQDCWSGILETQLNKEFKESGFKIETAAYGRGGDTAINSLCWAKSNLLSFQPDIVIVLQGINDMMLHGGPKYTYKGTSVSCALGQPIGIATRTKSFLLKYSQIFRRLRILRQKAFNYWVIKKGQSLEWHNKKLTGLRRKYQNLPFVDHPVRRHDPIFEFSDAMSVLLKFLTDAKIEVIVLGQPTLWKTDMLPQETGALWFPLATPNGEVRPSSAWLEKELCRYNGAQRNLARLYGATYIDLDRRIPKTLDYFFDDCHFTDLGSRLVASEILPIAKERVSAVIASQKKN